ncbi:TAXI family TRAP transporter solute-binding subunit [Gallaecimonas kandeliae]|uniref:TAXI family TRAP transporter solute-binding subunit n=1 Tax=Gallaecimonas kandeliae TaxID=3029055 RepID=UPI0026484B79|nr:TAXI family TRAP transporter solute-binding subunit [Gallaecimonas kandeliae]WKE63917.1 TAXI family TRAP transporter solute-binding subunit [Gallaecimonas kandeliae]
MTPWLKRALVTLSFAVALPAAAANYTIGTGSQSGTYYPFGGMLAKVWSENIDGFNMRAEVTAASVENIIKVAAGQQLAGIAMGDSVVAAIKGEPPFRRPVDVAVLFALYPNVVQFMVPANSDIHSVADLKGKKVSVGAPGSGTRVGSTAILKALGINDGDYKAQSLNYTATTEALANGQIDAGVIIGSAGVGAITELALTRDIRILSFSKDELAKIHEALPAYAGMDIPANTYNKVPAFTAPAVWNVLVVKKDMDPKLAGEMLKTAFANMDKIQNVIADAKNTTIANIDRLQGVPLHPASVAFMNEMKGK